jgi:hypothetical protein
LSPVYECSAVWPRELVGAGSWAAARSGLRIGSGRVSGESPMLPRRALARQQAARQDAKPATAFVRELPEPAGGHLPGLVPRTIARRSCALVVVSLFTLFAAASPASVLPAELASFCGACTQDADCGTGHKCCKANCTNGLRICKQVTTCGKE